MKKQSFGVVFFTGIFGIVFFLIMLGVLNLVADKVSNAVFQSVVGFLNANLLLIIAISLVMLLGNLFEIFFFPFNIPYPIFNAIGGMMHVVFWYKALFLIDSLVAASFFEAIKPLYIIALIMVPVIVLIVGYVQVFTGLCPKEEEKPVKAAKVSKVKKPKKGHTWEDVGDEFKEAFYNLGVTLKEAFEPKKGKK